MTLDVRPDTCPICGDAVVVAMPTDWQGAVAAGASVPILGCGNPWHYRFPLDAQPDVEALGEVVRAAEAMIAALDADLNRPGTRADADLRDDTLADLRVALDRLDR